MKQSLYKADNGMGKGEGSQRSGPGSNGWLQLWTVRFPFFFLVSEGLLLFQHPIKCAKVSSVLNLLLHVPHWWKLNPLHKNIFFKISIDKKLKSYKNRWWRDIFQRNDCVGEFVLVTYPRIDPINLVSG